MNAGKPGCAGTIARKFAWQAPLLARHDPTPTASDCRQALMDGNLGLAHAGLLATAERLRREALRLEGDMRQRHAALADRFQRQAERLATVVTSTRVAIIAAQEKTPLYPSDCRREPLRQPRQGLAGSATRNAPVPQDAPRATPAEAWREPLRDLDDLVGADTIKTLLRSRFVYPLRDPDRARRYRQRASGGVLLYGLPGTGKTHLVRALAAELGVPVFLLEPRVVLSKWLGESERHLEEFFSQARQHPASIVFADEIDGIATARDGGENNQATQRLLGQLLAELDGFAGKPGQLFFIGATNRPWDVDAALLRPGRFDALAYVDLPDSGTRATLLRRHLAGVPLADDIDFALVAAELEAYSAAETVAVAEQGARHAFLDAMEHDKDRPVTLADLRMAATEVHRVATPAMVERFRRFAKDHGLPPQDKRAPAAESS